MELHLFQCFTNLHGTPWNSAEASLERETRLELALHLFEKSKHFCDPVRLLYRFLYRFRHLGSIILTLHQNSAVNGRKSM